MTLFSVIFVLFFEQLQALPVARAVRQPVAAWCRLLERRFNDGRAEHGILAWVLGVLLPSLLVLLLSFGLWYYQPLLAFLLGLVVLYLTTGFRQFSHFFTEIHEALRSDDLDLARSILADWRGCSGDRLSRSDVARLAIEEALLASHRYVFAPLFWFLCLGPAGALIYRLAQLFAEHWGQGTDPELEAFGRFSQRAFTALDWGPTRLTAASFAIVGNFEDAVYCWRTQARRWPDTASGILLAAGAGALGVRLGQPVPDPEPLDNLGNDRPELGLGDEADADFLQSTIGLVWRTLVLVLLVLALVWVSGWMSG